MVIASWAIACQNLIERPYHGPDRTDQPPPRRRRRARDRRPRRASPTAPELGTNEIARRTGIDASTVSRLLATLADGGFVEHDDETGRYRLGLPPPALRQRSSSRRLDLRGRRSVPCSRSSPGGPARPPRSRRRRVPTRSPSTSSRAPGSVVERRASRPAERRARDRGRKGRARLRRAPSSRPGRLDALHRPHHRPPVRARGRSSSEVRRQGWVAAAEGEREHDLNAIAAPVFGSRRQRSRPSSACRDRLRASTREAMARASSRCSRRFPLAISHALGFDPELSQGERMSPTQASSARRSTASSATLGVELMDWEGWYWPNHFGDAVAEHHAVRERRRASGTSRRSGSGTSTAPDALAAADRDLHERHARARDRAGALRALLRRERQDGRRRHGLQVHGHELLGRSPRSTPTSTTSTSVVDGLARRDRADHREAPAPPAPGARARASSSPASPTRTSTSLRYFRFCPHQVHVGGVPVLGLAHRLLGRARLRALLRTRTAPSSSGRRSPVPARGRTASPRSRRSASSRG